MSHEEDVVRGIFTRNVRTGIICPLSPLSVILSAAKNPRGAEERFFAALRMTEGGNRLPKPCFRPGNRIRLSIYTKNFVINCDLLKPQAFSRQPNPHNCSMVASRE